MRKEQNRGKRGHSSRRVLGDSIYIRAAGSHSEDEVSPFIKQYNGSGNGKVRHGSHAGWATRLRYRLPLAGRMTTNNAS
jgi:hypothetical protein